MKAVLAALALALVLSTPSDGAMLEGQTIILDDDDVKACIDGGSCALITRKALEQLRGAAAECRMLSRT